MNTQMRPSSPVSGNADEAAIDSAYAATAVLALIGHAAESINSGCLDQADTQRLTRDIRRASELVEEMVGVLIDHLERPPK